MSSDVCSCLFTMGKTEKRVRGIEPPCAAWEAAVLPLNYTREEIFDFRFAIADCNRKPSLPRNHVVSCRADILVTRAAESVWPKRPCDYSDLQIWRGTGIGAVRVGYLIIVI